MHSRLEVLALSIIAALMPLAFHAAAMDPSHALSGWATRHPAMTRVADQGVAPPGTGHGYLIDKHLAAGVTCETCHAAGVNSSSPQPPTTTTCLGCHGGTYAALATQTAKDDPNPHGSHQGDVPCAMCHHVHMASESMCDQCHTEFTLTVP